MRRRSTHASVPGIRARNDAYTLALALGGAVRAGAGWLARCPVPGHGKGRGDRNPSLSLTDGEGGRVLLRCHAGCPQEAVLDALRARGLWGRREGGEHRPAPQLEPQPPRDAGPDLLARLARARELWRASRPAVGTLVESYLRARGITLAPPLSLRFHPGLWHMESGRRWPAMVAAVQGPDGAMLGAHRTYLRSDGSGKAPVSPARPPPGHGRGR